MGKYVINNSLLGKHHKFDEKLFEKYDIPARNKLKEILKEFVMDNPDPYKQDLIISCNDCKYKFIEIQVCTSWVGERFPFPNVYIFERKKFYDNDTLFLTLNKNLTKGLIFNTMSIKNSKPRRLKKYSREYVYDIPWHRILPFSLDNLDPDLIKMY